MHVLVIEDDIDLGPALLSSLRQEGFPASEYAGLSLPRIGRALKALVLRDSSPAASAAAARGAG